ncbi:MAG TPA: hypothetical protein VIL18_12300 [Longimicrobiales bacterium]
MRPLLGAVRAALLAVPLVAAACRGQDREAAEEARLRASVDDLLPRIEALAGLEARGPVRLALRDRAELREYVAARIEEELPPAELEGVEGAYRALGLVPDTLDLRALLLDLLTEQVIGYYDPATETLYVVAGVPREALEPVLAHELVHALQDQHVDLDSLVARERGNDRQTAAQAAIEGHATLVMMALIAERQAGQPVSPSMLPDLGRQLRPALEAENEQFPVFRSAPRILRETLLFPYLGGASFVQSLWRAAGAEQTPAPLDTLLPQSTEQVLHPDERFIRVRDEPTEIRLGESASGSGAGWRTVYENTLGELETSILLGEHLGSGAEQAARGWDGDRYRLLEGPSGGRALVWYSVWDGAAAADRFADAYRRVLERRAERRHGRVERLEVQGRPVVRVVDVERGVPLDSIPVPPLVALPESDR